MKVKNDTKSIYNLLRGVNTFSDEKPIVRVVIHGMTLGFWVICFLMLREWALPFWAANGIAGFKLSDLISQFKGRAP